MFVFSLKRGRKGFIISMSSLNAKLEPLLHPRSVAVIGASQDTSKIVGKPIQFLLRHQYRGRILPINPKYKEISGLPCYRDLASVPGEIDTAIIGLPAEGVLGVLKDCIQRKVKSVVIFASGYGEVGGEGQRMEDELRKAALDSGIILCGPNCQGVVNLFEGAAVSFSNALERHPLVTGNIAFITQSGAMGGSLFSNAQQMGIGFSYWISSGNEAVLETADYMEYVIADPRTQVILSYNEGVKDLQKFTRAAQAARRARKPIVAIRVGRTAAGKKAARAHTGAVSGPDEEVEQLFQKLGIIRVADVDEFLDIGSILSQGRFPKGRGVGILSTSGGAGALISDHCEMAGLEVPELCGPTRDAICLLIPPYGSALNPVDTTAMFSQKIAAGDESYYRRFFDALLKEPGIHSIIVMITMATGEMAKKLARDIVQVYNSTDKPIVVSWIAGSLAEEGYQILREGGVPLYMTTKRSVQAISALTQYAEFLKNS